MNRPLEKYSKRTREKGSQKRTMPMVLLIAAALFFAGAGGFLMLEQVPVQSQPAQQPVVSLKTSLHKTNPIDLGLAQYSDTHITTNAIDSNEKFRALALADYMDADTNFFSPHSQVAGAINALPVSSGEEYGTWIWTPLLSMTPDYIDSILKGAKANGINTIYVSVDSYLDVYVMPNGSDKDTKKKEYVDALENFVAKAHNAGVAVDAEAGWRNWAEDGNTYKAFAVINFVKGFNQTQKYTLRGFQYDVEPYLLAEYKTNPVPVLINYLRLIDQSITLLGTSDLKLSIVIPDFYDKDQTLIPQFKYNDKTSYAYDHILESLKRRPQSEVIVMSYRNFAAGGDGSIDNATSEIETATNGLYSTKIIVAQETGDVMPPYITFNNTTKKYYSDQINKINTAFAPYENFGGISVHYVNSYLDLK